MQGLAQKLWSEIHHLKKNHSDEWPLLKSWVDQGIVHPVDEALARAILKKAEAINENKALFLAYLLKAAREGHLCVQVNVKGIEPKLDDFKDLDDWESKIFQGAFEGSLIVRYEDLYYLERNWATETVCLENFYRLLKCEPDFYPDSTCIQTQVEGLVLQKGLLHEQSLAIFCASQYGLSILTGGPGTGKTFTAGHMVRILWEGLTPNQKKNFEIVLAAPTGKAADNLQKSMNAALEGLPLARTLTAQTLHSLLKHHSRSQNDAVLTADLIIVDECSMIDTVIMARLLKAVKLGARLILLGDKYQLPSVEIGSIFANLVDFVQASPKYAQQCVELKTCMRSELKGIVDFAQGIKSGQLDLEMKFDGINRLETTSILSNPKHFAEMLSLQFQSLNLNDFRILTPMRRGPWGVDALNKLIYLNIVKGQTSSKPLCIPIMITQNDEKMNLFNGQVGILKAHQNALVGDFVQGDTATFEGREIPALLLPKFELAYCISVHKSQGSEFSKVILLLPEGAEVFGREIFYTAVTRARQSIDLIASDSTLKAILAKRSLRLSGLSKRLT